MGKKPDKTRIDIEVLLSVPKYLVIKYKITQKELNEIVRKSLIFTRKTVDYFLKKKGANKQEYNFNGLYS